MKNSTHVYAFPKRLLATLAFAGTLAGCGALCAQPVGNGPPHPPPAEALQACKNLTSGQMCNFVSQRGTVQGTCWAPEGKALACKPKDASMGGAPAPKQ